MSEAPNLNAIRLRGVRHNNLKNFNLDLPLGQLIVITGLSGSGKSSLAFDTLYAEGQRRYIETFTPYARQFFDRMDRPAVDSIEGIPPAIAIEQRNAVKTTRSTVGTMTEICDYMKALWPHLATLHCRKCSQPVTKDTPLQVWKRVTAECGATNAECLLTFDLPLSEKLPLDESLALINKQGYQRLLVNGEIFRLDDTSTPSAIGSRPSAITVIQDRISPTSANRARFIEACEQAYHFGKGKLAIHIIANASSNRPSAIGNRQLFSNRLHCAACDLEYREPSPALFSFNHPLGACPACKGFGRIIAIDYNLVMPDLTRTLAEGVVKPWLTGHGLESQDDLLKFCKKRAVPTNVPFRDLTTDHQTLVLNGEPDYDSNDPANSWPRKWYGVKGYFRWLESKSYKMHVRVLLSRYRSYTTCPECAGKRFQPEALLYQFDISNFQSQIPASSFSISNFQSHISNPHRLTLADFYNLSIRDALQLLEQFSTDPQSKIENRKSEIAIVLEEVRARLAYLVEVGLGYLTLDRPTRTLSGGETERVNLTTCLGTRLVNTLFVLDEPSVGLHPRDTARLVTILERLLDTGNTVVVVEHEATVMRAANQLVDIGPGHGESGGHVVFQGSYEEILQNEKTLTGQYLSGQKRIEVPARRTVLQPSASAAGEQVGKRDSQQTGAPSPTPAHWLTLSHCTLHNLRDLTVQIPLGRFVCLTGVSGSGKTTLAREILFPLLESHFKSAISNLKLPPSSPDENSSANSAAPPNDDTENSPESAISNRPSAILVGAEQISRVVLVDQSALGKTPRSNPAVYIGAFDDIREVFAQSDLAKQRGLNASAFSFNSAVGQCERCRGAGFEKIEMQFLSDIFIRCPDCNGRRYRAHILEIRVQSHNNIAATTLDIEHSTADSALSIADVLDATVDEAILFLVTFTNSRPAQRAVASLRLLQEVGLGYLRLGQPINTLSGGESQRLKLVAHLTEFGVPASASGALPHTIVSEPVDALPAEAGTPNRVLFLFDEPTTGLHFDDVRVLLKVFQRLVDAGHSVIVIEHNLDVIKCADWLIDLGPDAGDRGGQIVAQGTPEQVAKCAESHTGAALRGLS